MDFASDLEELGNSLLSHLYSNVFNGTPLSQHNLLMSKMAC